VKRTLTISILLLLFVGGVSGEYLKDMSVTKVVDGDTVYASYKGKIHKMRLLEIDAPERDQPMGNESTAFLKGLLIDKLIDADITGQDRYERDLAKIYVKGKDINRIMVSNGMAWVYDAYVTDQSFYKNQALAQTQQLGVWSTGDAIPPWTWRRNR
jgi:micrococcal nuclease